MGSFRIIALTPPGTDDPAIAISASRAGEMGVLSLERAADIASARRALDGLARHGRGHCGVRLDPAREAFSALVAALPPLVRTAILTGDTPELLREAVATLKALGLAVLVEVTSAEEAHAAEQAGADGLIAKGHETGGWVGEETTFVLLQRLMLRPTLPVWAYGGIGLHTAAAAHAAGAAGVVLDAQLFLARESALPEAVRDAVTRMDGSETVCLGAEVGAACRLYARPGHASVEALRADLTRILGEDRPRAEQRAEWRRVAGERLGWGSPESNAWSLGQDAAFAAPLARQFQSAAGIVAGIRQAIDEHVRGAKAHRPLDAEGPLAESHGTRYPIAQGPMTRVSDRAEFALRVAEGGGLPFLALALMRGREVEALLKESQALLDGRPWGVGILGFVPLELRQEQMEVIRAYRPPYALIAGGRPDQARSLEKEGIPTYLHVPSPGLLRLFVQEGARRFVFEGRECGGHVGPRSSFVLWNLMVDVLLDLPAADLADCHVLFAGGIHDSLSAAMVAAMAAPLVEKGARIGVLLGTAYLFTEEAVSSQAIVKGFQEEAVRCDRTVLLETGPGHSTRCAETSFAEAFQREKQRLLREGKPPEEIRNELEMLNIGRLRVASKGVTRDGRPGQEAASSRLVEVGDEDQRREGMYMIGQVAALRDRTCTIEELHHSVAVEGSARLGALTAVGPAIPTVHPEPRPSQVAIVGISCLLPKARDRHAYWDNILNKVNAITEIPKERWDSDLYFDADPKTRDRIYSKWGGFLDDEPFDPTEFGMPPNSLSSIDPMQLLALKSARAALRDAGYLERQFDRSRTSVILGASGGTGDLGTGYLMRSSLPLLFGTEGADAVLDGAGTMLPEWTEDSFAGLLLNVAAGRIANRFDFGGLNYIVDAACASSLTAVHLAVKELETRNTDMVLVGGVDTTQNPFGYLCFSKTRALSPTGQARTFDATADGIAISEGIVMLVLKRVEDAERDGDRIYAVIQAVGGSSDGRAKGLTAPRPEGQMLALNRAYAKAGVSPTTVGLFEAHGTGTAAGDRSEALALSTVLEEAGAAPRSVAVGSVKSMIGHTKATAGVAGLAKVALALYHKVLPPTLGVTQPNPKARFGDGPLCVNSEPRPWIHGTADHPRRAGVNAFGFGGTNFHAILEEYTGDFLPRESAMRRRPTELLLWAGSSREDLAASLDSLDRALARGAKPELADLAHTLWRAAADAPDGARLAIVAGSLDDLRQKLASARTALAAGASAPLHDPRGIYFAPEPLARGGKVAFLFPGQGSQYPNMLRDLAIAFAPVREAFEKADAVLEPRFPRPLSSYVYPPPAFTPEEEKAQQQALTDTQVAQPALGAANIGLLALLRSLGVSPDMVAGHSYGEYAALAAAGVFDEETLAILSEARGRAIVEAAKDDLGTMAAVEAGPDAVAAALDGLADVWIANLNSPEQTIVSGTRAAVEQGVERLKAAGLRARPVAVSCAFHSPLVAPARERLAHTLGQAEFRAPQVPVFSNTTAAPHSGDPREIAAVLAQHLVEPVRFAEEVGALYEAGARVFVEVGPRNVLSALVRQILGDRPHTAIAVDASGRPGLTQLHHALGQLAAQGVAVRLDLLFEGRAVRRLNLAALEEDTREKPLSATTWMVNGGGIRPASRPAEPARRLQLALPSAVPVAALPQNGKAHDMTHTSAPVASSVARPNGAAAAAPAAAAPGSVLAPVPAVPVPDGSAQVMLQFQGLMARFLDTQRAVTLAYLQGTQAAVPEALVASAVAHVAPALPAPVVAPPPAAVEVPLVVVAPPALAPAAAVPVVAAAVSMPEALPPSNGHGEAEPDRARLTDQLLRIVGERTGYPPEMLDLDVDIEADLGIDSIKRVEILGNVQRACIPPDRKVAEKSMEQLTGIKTLRGIVGWLENALSAGNGHAAAAPANGERSAAAHGNGKAAGNGNGNGSAVAGGNGHAAGNGKGNGHANGHGNGHAAAAETPAAGAPRAAQPARNDELVVIPRSVLVAADAPALRGPAVAIAADRLVIVTDDGRGIAQAACEELRGKGARVALLRHQGAGGDNVPAEPGVYRADLTDPDGVSLLLDHLRREHGPVGGILHLLPLSDHAAFDAMDLAAWRAVLRRDVKSLFYLAREAASDFKQAGDGGWLLAASAMGAAYAGEPAGAFFPGQAALAGFVKSLAIEWPGTHCKAVALDMHDPAAVRADELMAELGTRDGLVEVAYTGGRRRTLHLRLAPVDTRGTAQVAIAHDWVLLVTGGARGITAEVACELAERYRPTLVLLGRSPLPEPEEPAATRELTSPMALKAALLEGLRQSGQPVSVAQVESAFQRLLKDREIRANLARMQSAGSAVHYHAVDARDEVAMRALVEKVYHEHGRLDGVIHGAGVIEDKLVEDKTTESFDRVFDTKAESAFVLSRVLRPETLRFLAFFGSASGPFGNRGQADYAAANEVLNKLAVHLDRAWPTRVVSLSWGPWLKTGMVSPEMQREFARRGVELISIPTGCRLFDQELRHGTAGEPQVVLAGGAWSAQAEVKETPAPKAAAGFPLLQHATFNAGGHVVEATRTFDVAHDPYLMDHRMDGAPVVPLAVALELMAEVAQKGWPDLQVIGVREMQLLRGVVLDKGPRPVKVIARAQVEPPHDRTGIDVNVEVRDAGATGHLCYRATVELGSALPEAPRYQPREGESFRSFPLSLDQAYRDWLFHGPRLQGITHIDGLSDRAIGGALDASAPPPCFDAPLEGRWLIDPVMFDSALQLFVLWVRAQLDKTTLPSRFARYRRFGSLSDAKLTCHIQVLDRSRDPLYHLDIAFVGPDGRLRGLLEGMEGTCSRALNRLVGQPERTALAGVAGDSPSL